MPSQQPGSPYIQRPEGATPDADILYCFIDPNRPCTAECVAFDIPSSTPGRTSCIVVNALKQIASGSVNSAKYLQEAVHSPAAPMPPVVKR